MRERWGREGRGERERGVEWSLHFYLITSGSGFLLPGSWSIHGLFYTFLDIQSLSSSHAPEERVPWVSPAPPSHKASGCNRPHPLFFRTPFSVPPVFEFTPLPPTLKLPFPRVETVFYSKNRFLRYPCEPRRLTEKMSLMFCSAPPSSAHLASSRPFQTHRPMSQPKVWSLRTGENRDFKLAFSLSSASSRIWREMYRNQLSHWCKYASPAP